VERLVIASWEGEASGPCGVETRRCHWLYAETAAIAIDVLGIDEKDEEGNIVAYVGNVHVQ
jgi:hypothetical protein